jgi:CHAT domain-containing protein
MDGPFKRSCDTRNCLSTLARDRQPLLGGCLLLLGVLVAAGPALALTFEEAREKCRESVGRPIVQSCMHSKGYGPGSGKGRDVTSKDADLEQCRSKARPSVEACVRTALSNARPNVPVAIPQEKASNAPVLDGPPASFVAPPRTIGDITALLDSEKPDPAGIEKLKAEADAKPPSGKSAAETAWFYYMRGTARAQLGRLEDSLADANKAIEVGRGGIEAQLLGRLQQLAGLQYMAAGNPKRALAIFSDQVRDTDAKGARGHIFNGNLQISMIYLQMGDLAQADAYLRRSLTLIQEARTSGLPGWRASYPVLGQSWESSIENNRGLLFEARGQFREAETAYRAAELRRRASIPGILSWKYPPPASQMLYNADALVLAQARMKARLGRLAEAEAEARRALLARLKDQGKYHPQTPKFLTGLADILVEQGRYQEAERLMHIAIEINYRVGVVEDSQSTAHMLASLGGILNLQRRFEEASAVYAKLDAAIARWEPLRREALELNGSRIYSLYAAGQVEAGIAAAQALLKRQISRVGEKHFDTATARGTLAIGYVRAGKDADAVREFRAAIPVLMATARESAGDDDTTVVAARRERLQNIVESYIGVLARSQRDSGGDVVDETFRLGDAIRGQSVQHALAASSARMTAKDPALSDLIRKEQDLTMQANALLGTLNNVLALPASERDEQGVKSINATIERTRAERNSARNEIARRFPSYADLIDPRPPSVEALRDTLRQGEALLAFYFGNDASFVWVVPKEGPPAFAPIGATGGAVESKVRKLREALESQAASLAEYPAFDLALAHELYALLLEPVEAAWKPAKSLIVVTNGALGLLPLSLLPTAPSQLKESDGPLFASYRNVPWLARSHAVTMVPSSAALRALRNLPAASNKREPLIGFGDPYFSAEQALQAESEDQKPIQVAALSERGPAVRRRAAARTSGIDSAELSRLPRLPDTADELRSIAAALNLDPAKVLHLGRDANEQVVKSTDLSRFRIVAFSTHGLLPGDLNGLTQPALALSAPDVAGVEGDGLLTMEKILPLKLDADWVVLSACNTAAGAQAGAEAASGLGRAFFYAGSRSLLVTNWSVDSASARDLVSDIFRRQAADARLSRGEVLRQAMVALMDGPGFVDNGRTLYTYGHPMFWAPYSLIGDGGN